LLIESSSNDFNWTLSRLRKEKLLCGVITAFVQSNPFDPSVPYYSKTQTYKFYEPTDCVLELAEVAYRLLEKIYKPGIKYKKCGVFYSELIVKSNYTPDLLSDHETRIQNENLMQVYEDIQAKFGKAKISVGPCYFKDRKWSMSRDMLSKNYFTKNGLIKVQ